MSFEVYVTKLINYKKNQKKNSTEEKHNKIKTLTTVA